MIRMPMKTNPLTLQKLLDGPTSGAVIVPNKRFITSSTLTITPSSTTTVMPKKEDLTFGTTYAPHMLQILYNNNQWSNPEIVPYGKLSISPASACLNYGMTCFEGMKAYRSLDDSSSSTIRLFRPHLNMRRLSNSMERLSLPGFDFSHDELISCIMKLVHLDRDWVPHGEGYSLYLRPNVIGLTDNLGLANPTSLLLYVVTSPVGPYYKSGFKPVRLICETRYIRAINGGTGNSKVGGNYAPTMKPAREAESKGYNQVLWLLNGEVTEVGSMNVFFVFEHGDNRKKEIVTPPLSRGDILPGVTRRSIIELSSTWDDYELVERNVKIDEIHEAIRDGRMVEAFGTGTAAVVSPIECINYEGKDLEIPATGNLTQKIWDSLLEIQYGKANHEWSVKINV